jgi:ABC-type uncharacterized transport system permease subunit
MHGDWTLRYPGRAVLIFTVGSLIGFAAGVLAAVWLARTQPDNVAAGIAFGLGGVALGALAALAVVRRLNRREVQP